MTRVNLSPAARQDLLEIWLYIADDSVLAADNVIDQIDDKCHDLAEYPLSGEAESDLGKDLRSIPAGVGDDVIFHRPVANGVEIARIIHGMRDLPSLL